MLSVTQHPLSHFVTAPPQGAAKWENTTPFPNHVIPSLSRNVLIIMWTPFDNATSSLALLVPPFGNIERAGGAG